MKIKSVKGTPYRQLSFWAKCFVALSTPVLLNACASYSPDGGFSNVQQTTKQFIGQDIYWQKTDQEKNLAFSRIKELLTMMLMPGISIDL